MGRQCLLLLQVKVAVDVGIETKSPNIMAVMIAWLYTSKILSVEVFP